VNADLQADRRAARLPLVYTAIVGRMCEGRVSQLRVLRLIEATSGILAALAGGAALAFLLFAPTYSTEGCHTTDGAPPICVTRTATLLEVNGAAAVVDLSIVALLLLGVALAAVWHSGTGLPVPRIALWLFAAALAVFAILALLSIGVLLLPSVALALVACFASLGRGRAAAA